MKAILKGLKKAKSDEDINEMFVSKKSDLDKIAPERLLEMFGGLQPLQNTAQLVHLAGALQESELDPQFLFNLSLSLLEQCNLTSAEV